MLFEVFPAPAGVILTFVLFVLVILGFPRTCGGDPKGIKKGKENPKFSPHLRG